MRAGTRVPVLFFLSASKAGGFDVVDATDMLFLCGFGAGL
jgi:hypothetical protein